MFLKLRILGCSNNRKSSKGKIDKSILFVNGFADNLSLQHTKINIFLNFVRIFGYWENGDEYVFDSFFIRDAPFLPDGIGGKSGRILQSTHSTNGFFGHSTGYFGRIGSQT
jgi:hypothetical protein